MVENDDNPSKAGDHVNTKHVTPSNSLSVVSKLT